MNTYEPPYKLNAGPMTQEAELESLGYLVTQICYNNKAKEWADEIAELGQRDTNLALGEAEMFLRVVSWLVRDYLKHHESDAR